MQKLRLVFQNATKTKRKNKQNYSKDFQDHRGKIGVNPKHVRIEVDKANLFMVVLEIQQMTGQCGRDGCTKQD